MIAKVPDKEQEPGLVSKALKVLAYPIAALAGYWITRNQIRHSEFTKLKEEKELRDITDPYKKAKLVINKKIKEAPTKEAKKTFQKEAAELSRDYTNNIRKRFEELGVDTMHAQLKDIYKPQFHKALLEGFTGASIVLIGILSLADSKALTHLFNKEEKDSQQNQL